MLESEKKKALWDLKKKLTFLAYFFENSSLIIYLQKKSPLMYLLCLSWNCFSFSKKKKKMFLVKLFTVFYGIQGKNCIEKNVYQTINK